MRVLLTPHIEHYTIGLSSELSKLVKLTLLTEKRFNTQTNQIVISNLPIPHFKGLMRKIIFKISGDIYDVIHVNTSQDGLFAGNFDKLLVTSMAGRIQKLSRNLNVIIILKSKVHYFNFMKWGFQ